MGSLLFLTILSLRATLSHPGSLRKPHYIIAETVSQVLTSVTVESVVAAFGIFGAAY
jgi:hypothetical protein